MMKRAACLILAWAVLPGGAAFAQTAAERLAASYTAVTSMTCTVRRELAAEGKQTLHLSRVWFARPDRLRVESSLPVTRVIVADGTDLFYHIEGDARGLRRPIGDLREDMRLEIRRVPGTAMDHLLRLLGLPETVLPAADGWPARVGYDTGRAYVVLGLDAAGRLGRVEIFDGPGQERRLARYDYDSFREAAPGVWLACRQESRSLLDGREVRELMRLEDPVVNAGIPAERFDAAPAFPGVVFTPEGDADF